MIPLNRIVILLAVKIFYAIKTCNYAGQSAMIHSNRIALLLEVKIFYATKVYNYVVVVVTTLSNRNVIQLMVKISFAIKTSNYVANLAMILSQKDVTHIIISNLSAKIRNRLAKSLPNALILVGHILADKFKAIHFYSLNFDLKKKYSLSIFISIY